MKYVWTRPLCSNDHGTDEAVKSTITIPRLLRHGLGSVICRANKRRLELHDYMGLKQCRLGILLPPPKDPILPRCFKQEWRGRMQRLVSLIRNDLTHVARTYQKGYDSAEAIAAN